MLPEVCSAACESAQISCLTVAQKALSVNKGVLVMYWEEENTFTIVGINFGSEVGLFLPGINLSSYVDTVAKYFI